MANRPLSAPLPADLPEDWTDGQIVAPSGASAGLSEQHGYNYLMEMVNRAQEAVNTINEGFDDISGKRTCRFVVGTSTAGWTQADCDYLCDGTDDQVEIQAAVDAAPAVGCEIVLLDGTYHLNGAVNANKSSIWIHGNGRSTVLQRETEDGNGDLKFILMLWPGCRLSDLMYNGQGKAQENCFDIYMGGSSVDNVVFFNCGYGCLYVGGDSSVESLDIITNCVCTGEFAFVRAHLSTLNLLMDGNSIEGVTYLLDTVDAAETAMCSIMISNNKAMMAPGAVSINTKNVAGYRNFMISNNVLSKIEVETTENDPSSQRRGAVICGNTFFGTSDDNAAITLGPNTKNNFVFGNMLIGVTKDLIIADYGAGNIVFGNSNDTGGGSGTAGVSSFKGRTGAVVPASGDYTAAMVGAVPSGDVAAVRAVTQAEYDAMDEKDDTTLYLIKE